MRGRDRQVKWEWKCERQGEWKYKGQGRRDSAWSFMADGPTHYVVTPNLS